MRASTGSVVVEVIQAVFLTSILTCEHHGTRLEAVDSRWALRNFRCLDVRRSSESDRSRADDVLGPAGARQPRMAFGSFAKLLT